MSPRKIVPCLTSHGANDRSASRPVACIGIGVGVGIGSIGIAFRKVARVIGTVAVAYPLSALAHEAIGPSYCQPLPAVQAWLDLHIDRWDAVLAAEPGYERPSAVTVCRAPPGRPFADNRSNRVFVRGIQTVDEQTTVAHEYVHIAFQHYPSGHNEGYVERTARRLIADHP